MSQINKNYWYKVTKKYRNNESIWQICVDKLLSKKDKRYIAESIGENTPGGHSYGWSIYIRKINKKSKHIKTLERTKLIELW